MPNKSSKLAVVTKSRRAKSGDSSVHQLFPARLQYVLDTNVLLHDPTSLFRFEEHDVYLPLIVLEELDRHKRGVADIARNARQVTRTLDELLTEGSMGEGFPLAKLSNGQATGRLFIRDVDDESPSAPRNLAMEKADNQILAFTMGLLKGGAQAVLVTKDINLRVKALACDIPAQDYRNDRVLSDSDILPTGFIHVSEDFWAARDGVEPSYWRAQGRQWAKVAMQLPVNSFVSEDAQERRPRIWRVVRSESGSSDLMQLNGTDAPNDLLTPRNEWQVMALSLLHDESVDVVALLGMAGAGKTLLAIAAGLAQVEQGRFREVMLTRVTVPLGEKVGFVPGSESDKMAPWLGGTLKDVFLALGLDPDKSPERNKVEIAAMSYMRGRSFHDKYIIIDEAQNLTSEQMRTLLTRVGPGSKIVLCGNLQQIDTPYLDEGSSGLAWAVKTLHNWAHSGALILPRGERSRLATYVEAQAAAAA